MPQKTLCIIGLGLVGGSVAASLKARGAPWRVRAADRRRSALEVALRKGYVDEPFGDPIEAARGADLVLLAAPVSEIRRLVETLGPTLNPGQLLTDVGRTKASILAQAERSLPEGVAFVGGHPIAVVERSGSGDAVPGLFEGKICVLTPTETTPRHALETVAGLWMELGAEVQFMAADAHDALLARLSHLPSLVVFTLLRSVATRLSPANLRLGGGGLRDFTRASQSLPGPWKEICLENREAIGEAVDEFLEQLQTFRAAVARGDGDAIEEFLGDAAEAKGNVWPE